jgi:hypothetical protein
MPVLERTRLPHKIGEVNPEIRIKLENIVLLILGYSPGKRASAPIFPRSRKLELFVYAVVEFCRCSKVNLMFSSNTYTTYATGKWRRCAILCPLRSRATPEAPLETFLISNKCFLFCSPLEKVKGYK